MKKIILSTVCLAVMTTFAALNTEAATVLDKVQSGVDKASNAVIKADKTVTTARTTAKTTTTTAKSTSTSVKTSAQNVKDSTIESLEKQKAAELAKIQKKIDAAKSDVKTLESNNATLTEKAQAVKNMNEKTSKLRKEYKETKKKYDAKIKAAKKAQKASK